jgi:hypothetical protein
MTPERDESSDEQPTEGDPLGAAILPMIEAVFEMTAPDSAERARAMTEVLELPGRIRSAISRPRLGGCIGTPLGSVCTFLTSTPATPTICTWK